jgi:RimJ/RimL family protein N-acetyltransferase
VNGRVRLRLLEEADLPMTLAWRNQDHIRKWFLHSDVISPQHHHDWWQRYQARDDDFVFVIEETETLRRPVGQIALYNIDPATRRAEFGRLMIADADARGLGLARLATARLVREAFSSAWQLDELYLEVLAGNEAALHLYRVAGFKESGVTGAVRRMTLTRGAERLRVQD